MKILRESFYFGGEESVSSLPSFIKKQMLEQLPNLDTATDSRHSRHSREVFMMHIGNTPVQFSVGVIASCDVDDYEMLREQVTDDTWMNTWAKNASAVATKISESCMKAAQDARMPSGTSFPFLLLRMDVYHSVRGGKNMDSVEMVENRLYFAYPDTGIEYRPSGSVYYMPDASYDGFVTSSTGHYINICKGDYSEGINSIDFKSVYNKVKSDYEDDWNQEYKRKYARLYGPKTAKSKSNLNLTNDQLGEIWTALGEIISDDPWYSSTLNDAGTESDDPEVQEMIDLQDKIDIAIDGGKKLAQKDIKRAIEICQDNGREFDFAE